MAYRCRGVFQVQGATGTTETPTQTCPHCNTIFVLKKGATEYGFCHQCNAPTCTAKKCTDRCSPWEKKLLRRMRRDESRRSMGL